MVDLDAECEMVDRIVAWYYENPTTRRWRVISWLLGLDAEAIASLEVVDGH